MHCIGRYTCYHQATVAWQVLSGISRGVALPWRALRVLAAPPPARSTPEMSDTARILLHAEIHLPVRPAPIRSPRSPSVVPNQGALPDCAAPQSSLPSSAV